MSGFKEGDLILSCSPFAYALRSEFKNKYCDFCFKENSHLIGCTRCSFAYYCDESCQSNAWDLHETECKYLKRADQKPDAHTRCAALILFKTKKYGINKPFVEIEGRKVSFATLISHAEDMKQNAEEKCMVKDFSLSLESYIGTENIPSQDEIYEIYGKIRINAFSIQDVFQEVSLGIGLYLESSIFDHSCDPDALGNFDGTVMNIRLRKNVSHRNISEIRLSYISSSLKLTEERQMHLLKTYHFHCECKLCIDSRMDDLKTKLVTDSNEIKEIALKCEKEFEEKEKSVKELLTKDPRLAWQECEKLLKEQTNVFADTNIYQVKTLQMMWDACMSLNASKDAIKIASRLENVLKLYFGIHPKFAIFLFSYGQHLLLSGFVIEGALKLAEAINVIKIIYGEEHPLCKKMISKFSDLQSNVQGI